MLTLVGLAVLDWRFLMAALLAVPIQVLTARWYLACSTPLYAEQRVVGGVQQQLLDTVGGVATARAFGLSGGHAERVRSRSQDVVDLALGVVRLQTRFFGRLNLAEFVGVAAVLTAGFFLVAAGPRRSARPARRRCTSSTCSLRSTSCCSCWTPRSRHRRAWFGSSGWRSCPPSSSPSTPVRPVDAAVRTKDLGHSYVEGHEVLRRCRPRIAPGTRVALVGASGAGKTTLAKLGEAHRQVRRRPPTGIASSRPSTPCSVSMPASS